MKRNWRQRFQFLFVFSQVLFAFLFFSCKKNNEVSSYYGSWMTTKAIPIQTVGYIDGSFNLTISENEFEEYFVDYIDGITYRHVLIRGSFFVSENSMKFEAKQISFTSLDYNSEPYAIYTNEDEKFGYRLSGLQNIVSGHTAEFMLNGNELVLKINYSEDENFPDYAVTVTYNRVARKNFHTDLIEN